jgi:hypothetical protein
MVSPIEIVIVACLAAAPEECREHRLRLTISGGDAAQCLYSSPPRIARWQIMHPAWKLKSWRCAVVSEDEAV